MHAVLLSIPVQTGNWCQRVATHHPDANVIVESIAPLASGGCVETVAARGPHANAVLATMRADGGEVELIERRGDGLRIRVKVDDCPLACVMLHTALAPRLPFHIEPGADRWLIVGQNEALRASMNMLAEQGHAPSVVWSGPWDVDRDQLTVHQRRVLVAAVDAGYYAYPRRITLTRLAERLGVSKSTLSETLMLVEEKVVRDFLARA